MSVSSFITNWVPTIIVALAISWAFRDWPGWRFIETILVGGGMGHLLVVSWFALRFTALEPLLEGKIVLLPGFIFGIILFTRLIPRYAWISRYGFLWIIGATAGLAISSLFQGNILVQVIRSVDIIGATRLETFNNFIAFIGFITVLSYFIFTREHTGILGISTQIGRKFMMIALGVAFAVLISMYYYVALERIWAILKSFGVLVPA
jgi:hypothetical protein